MGLKREPYIGMRRLALPLGMKGNTASSNSTMPRVQRRHGDRRGPVKVDHDADDDDVQQRDGDDDVPYGSA